MKIWSSSSSSSSILVARPTTRTRTIRRHVSNVCDETYRRRKVAHRVSAISSSSKSDNSSNEKDDNDEQFAPTKEGEQNEVLQSTDEEKLGRAAQYMRELIKRQVRSNDLPRAGSLTDSTVLRRKGR